MKKNQKKKQPEKIAEEPSQIKNKKKDINKE